MESNYILYMSIFLIVILIYFTFLNNESRVIWRLLKHKRKQISDIKTNEVARVKGKIVYAGATITAPLSNRKCVMYSLRVRDNSGSKEVFKNFISINEIKASDILIFDGVNYAYIDNKVLTAHIVEDDFQRSNNWNMTSPELMEFLKKHDYPTTDYIGWNLDLDAHEGIIEEGEIVTVSGKCSWRKSSTFNLHIPDQEILYIEPEENNTVYITDDRQI